MAVASVLWRRIDTPGHDACRLVRIASGWRIEGTAVFRHEGVPTQLAYYVECDLAWRTKQGHVKGWIGTDALVFSVARTETGAWTLNDTMISSIENCVDVDFGFTPATNLLQLRRLALKDGQAAEASAAWFDVSTGTLDLLPQRYERRAETAYWYEAPSFGYAALLEVAPIGFILRYPGLWEAEP